MNTNCLTFRKNTLFVSIVLYGMVVCLGACAQKPVPPPHISFIIQSKETTNNGQPFYIAVRSVNSNQFITDSYDGVAATIFSNPANDSLLTARAILPGQEIEVKIEKPEKDEIGIYCFFTHPGDPWKIKLNQPLDDKYEINLQENRIVQPQKLVKKKKKKGLLGRLWPF